MLNKLKGALLRFMYGRCGGDQLNTALILLYVLFAILGRLSRWPLFTLLMFATMVWTVFRMLSRNLAARRRENDAFLRLRRPVKDWFVLQKNRIRDCRTHVYHTCPHCKSTLRLPRKKGKHSVRCPRCGDKFEMKVYFGGK